MTVGAERGGDDGALAVVVARADWAIAAWCGRNRSGAPAVLTFTLGVQALPLRCRDRAAATDAAATAGTVVALSAPFSWFR